MSVRFFFKDSKRKVPERKKLRDYVRQIFEEEGKELSSLTYVFCSDDFLLGINKEFLNHDDFTDVITFTLSEPAEPITGEIYISTERVMDNSNQLNINYTEELHRVIFHGALHLCGYKDKTPADKLQMTLAENKSLKRYFR